MNKIIRFYNQNRKLFWAIIISFVLGFGILQSLNKNYKETNKNGEKNNEINIITTTKQDKNYSVVSNKEITETENENAELIIKQFIEFCNNKDIQNAYKMLSEDCKKELYPTIEDFNKSYISSIFEQSKMYEMQLWKVNGNVYTYSIKFTEDILATGNANGEYIQEYYTIIKEQEEYSLNINDFIFKENINIEKEQENVKFTILEKSVYNEYEEYVIQVKNLTSANICIDKKESTKTVFIKTSKDLKYYANLYEISNNSLILKPGEKDTYKIKFEKGYRDNEITKTVNFYNIVLNYNLDSEKNIEVIIEI